MSKFSTWMILSLSVVFWILRIVGTYMAVMGIDFMVKPLDTNVEIMLLFVTLLSFIFIAKRKLLGPILYMVAYGGYFGVYIFNNLAGIAAKTFDATQYINVFFAFIGMVLPIFTLFDWLLDKNKKLNPRDKKTDWFYRNQNFDRKFDDRADKNNYKTL